MNAEMAHGFAWADVRLCVHCDMGQSTREALCKALETRRVREGTTLVCGTRLTADPRHARHIGGVDKGEGEDGRMLMLAGSRLEACACIEGGTAWVEAASCRDRCKGKMGLCCCLMRQEGGDSWSMVSAAAVHTCSKGEGACDGEGRPVGGWCTAVRETDDGAERKAGAAGIEGEAWLQLGSRLMRGRLRSTTACGSGGGETAELRCWIKVMGGGLYRGRKHGEGRD